MGGVLRLIVDGLGNAPGTDAAVRQPAVGTYFPTNGGTDGYGL